MKQLNSEVIITEINKKTKRKEEFYGKVTSSAHNHLWDTFCMFFAMQSIEEMI